VKVSGGRGLLIVLINTWVGSECNGRIGRPTVVSLVLHNLVRQRGQGSPVRHRHGRS